MDSTKKPQNYRRIWDLSRHEHTHAKETPQTKRRQYSRNIKQHDDQEQTRIRRNEHATHEMLHAHAHACMEDGAGGEGSTPLPPHGEAPKNPAGANARGSVGIPPNFKATTIPTKPRPSQLFLFLVFFFIFCFPWDGPAATSLQG